MSPANQLTTAIDDGPLSTDSGPHLVVSWRQNVQVDVTRDVLDG